MSKFSYVPKGVCSSYMEFEIEDNIIKAMKVFDGCDANLRAVSILCIGMNIDDVINQLEDIKCGSKVTSCPNQIAKALRDYKTNNDLFK